MNLSQRIKDLRKLQGLTQEKLAQKLNISAQSVSKWENGQSEPDISTVVKLAGIFNMSVDSFLEVKNKKDYKSYFKSLKKVEDVDSTFDGFIDPYLTKKGDTFWELGVSKLIKAVIEGLVYSGISVSLDEIRKVLMIEGLTENQGDERQEKLEKYFSKFPKNIQRNALQVLESPKQTFKCYLMLVVDMLDKIEKE